jgi:hypothetical protein
MKRRQNSEQCFREFRCLVKELVLCIGGVFAVHPVDDEVVWELARGLDGIIAKSSTRLLNNDDTAATRDKTARLRPHPAIEELLRRVDDLGGGL